MAKTPAARMSALMAATCLAFTVPIAHAERPAQSSLNAGAIPRANPNAVRNEWRGPVTTTGSVALPQRRERVAFTYPGMGKAPRSAVTTDPEKRIAPNPSQAVVQAAAFTEERGIASWYGEAFHGRETANGEVFDMNAMTAAHPTLPLPSLVRVINEKNGREVVVRVNDRGPFGSDRIIDLSKRAAAELGLLTAGTAPVTISYVGPAPALDDGTAPGLVLASASNGIARETSSAIQLASAEEKPGTDLYGNLLLGGAEPTLGVPDPGQSIATPARPAPVVRERTSAPAPIVHKAAYSPAQSRPASFGPQIFVQVGSFTQLDNAQSLSASVGGSFTTDIEAARVKGADYFRVFAGPFPTREAAEQARQALRSAGIKYGFVTLR